jgi:hypothetical protein
VDVVWFVLLLLLSNAITFYLCLFAGKQARYSGLVLLRSPRWLKNEWLCPKCLGTHNVDGGICFFCLANNQLRSKKSGVLYEQSRLGYVEWSYLIHEWDWRHWHEQPYPLSLRPRRQAQRSST